MEDTARKHSRRVGQIEKQFGKGSVMRSRRCRFHIRCETVRPVRSGSTSRWASAACRAGASSKSTVRSLPARPRYPPGGGRDSAQRRTAAFVDAEHALDPAYAGKLGVNIDELLVSQPDTGEQALEITDMLVRSGAVDVVVIDSVAASRRRPRSRARWARCSLACNARLMSQALRKLTGNIKRSNTLVIFINQIRMKIGVMFGSPETTTGGNALQVLRLGAPRHPPHRRDQRTAKRSPATSRA